MSNFPSVAFLAGSVGTGEWIVLFVVILIVVGPKRLPEIARTIGRTMEMFRRAADEFKDQIMSMDKEAPATRPATPDVDGVPSSGTAPDGAGESGSYEDAYPNMSDYPGNEDQVENWSSEPLVAQPPVESTESAGGAPAAPEQAQGQDAGGAQDKPEGVGA